MASKYPSLVFGVARSVARPCAGLLPLVAGLLLLPARAEDTRGSWPQWRGPDRSNRSTETGLLQEWPTEGPPLRWKISGLGQGIATVSVADGRLLTVGYRDNAEFVHAIATDSGDPLWSRPIGPLVRESPLMRWLSQRTPTLDGDRLYAFAANGALVCLRSADGQELWRKDYPADFASPRVPFGYCDHPLVDGDRLICVPGGPDATLVALDKRTGQVIWKAVTDGKDMAAYTAAIRADLGGVPQVVAFLAQGLAGIEAATGRVLWRHPWPMRHAHSYSPMLVRDAILGVSGYGGRVALIRFTDENGVPCPKEAYSVVHRLTPFQECTVVVDQHLYTSRMPLGAPVCVRIADGSVAWEASTLPRQGRAAITYADRRLYFRASNGIVRLFEANPAAYVERGAFTIPDREEAEGVTSPVVAGGHLFLRDNDRLLCYDVRADRPPGEAPAPRTIALTIAPPAVSPAASTNPGAPGERTSDAVFVPTPHDVVTRMLELAGVAADDLLYDLGSGDGRIVLAAAGKSGCRAIGYEIDADLVLQSQKAARDQGLDGRARFEQRDLFTVDLAPASVVAVFLPPPLLERLLPQLRQLKPGAKIVSHQFLIPGFPPTRTEAHESKEDGEIHKIHLWTAPFPQAPIASP